MGQAPVATGSDGFHSHSFQTRNGEASSPRNALDDEEASWQSIRAALVAATPSAGDQPPPRTPPGNDRAAERAARDAVALLRRHCANRASGQHSGVALRRVAGVAAALTTLLARQQRCAAGVRGDVAQAMDVVAGFAMRTLTTHGAGCLPDGLVVLRGLCDLGHTSVAVPALLIAAGRALVLPGEQAEFCEEIDGHSDAKTRAELRRLAAQYLQYHVRLGYRPSSLLLYALRTLDPSGTSSLQSMLAVLSDDGVLARHGARP